jgi:hypothetical protein
MNGVNFSVVENSKDICFDPGIEEEYSINEMLSLLRKGIPEKLVPFLDVLTEGLNRNEIEELFSISYWELQGRISQLQKYGRKILKR